MEEDKNIYKFPEINKDFYEFNEVCSFLRVSRRTLSRYVKNEGLPSYKIKKKVLFKKADINAFIEKFKRLPQNPAD